MNKLGKVAVALAMAFSVGAALGEEPAVYLEYLQGNGAQWINTGYTPTKDARVVADVELDPLLKDDGSRAGYQYDTFFCSRTDATKNMFSCWNYFYNSNNDFCKFEYGNTVHPVTGEAKKKILPHERMTLECSKSGLKVNDVWICGGGDADFTPGGPLVLFAAYTGKPGSNVSGYYGYFKLYSFKVYDLVDGEEKLVRDLKPAIDKIGAGGKEGLYDAVSGEFFTNQGTGFFRLGPEVGTGAVYHPASVTSKGNGTVEFTTGIYAHGTTYALEAVPAEGYQFHLWNGTTDCIGDNMRSANVTLKLNDTVELTCDFKRSGPAQRVYVAPTAAGAKDGSSWENAMNDVAKACAKVAEYAAGGEVWIKTGAYVVMSSSVPLSDNISVLGGFAGTETSADEADEEANPVLLYGQKFTAATWLMDGGASTGVKLADTTTTPYSVNLPPVEQFPEAHAFYIDQTYIDRPIFYVGNELSATNCHFRGLTVAATGDYTIGSDSRLADGMTVERCTFIGCRPYVNNTAGILMLNKTIATVEDCAFIGCGNALTMGGIRPVTNVVRRCLFWHCVGINNIFGAAGVTIGGRVSANVEDCRFEHLADNGCSTAALRNDATADDRLELTGCIFSNCWITGSSAAATTRFLGGSVAIDGCQYVGNEYVLTKRGNYGQATCITSDSSLTIRNSSFIRNRNRCVGLEGNDGYSDAVIGSGYTGSLTFVLENCTLEDNVGEGDYAKSGIMFGAWRSVGVVAINCTFLNNRCTNNNGRQPDLPVNSGQPVVAVNTVVWGDDADYASADPGTNLGIANSVLKNYPNTPETVPSGNGFFLAPISTDDPVLADATVTDPKTGRTYRSLDLEDSPFRRAGRPVWKGTDGAYYIHTSGKTPWRRISGEVATLDDASAAALGVTLAAAPIEDVVGKARSKRHCALGPLDLPVPGLMLLVK